MSHRDEPGALPRALGRGVERSPFTVLATARERPALVDASPHTAGAPVDLGVVPTRKRSARAGLAVILVGVVACAGFLIVAVPWWRTHRTLPLTTVACVWALVAVFHGVHGALATRRGVAPIRVDAHGVHGRRGLHLAAADIRDHAIAQEVSSIWVHLTGTSGRGFDFGVRNLDQALAVLHALRRPFVQRVAEYTVPAPFTGFRRVARIAAIPLTVLLLVGATAVASLSRESGMMVAALHLVLPILLVGLAHYATKQRQAKLRVGADGLSLEQDGHRRFVPYASIVAIAQQLEGPHDDKGIASLVLQLDGGEEWVVPCATRAPAEQAQHDALVRHVFEAAIGQHHAPDVVLPRTTDDPHEAVRRLRALAAGAIGPRDAAVPPEALWRAVESPQVDGRIRARAAVALSAGLDERGRGRIAASAQATVEPRVRIVLDAVAEGRADDELASALGALEDGLDRRSDLPHRP